jgi:pyruvate dehydrogenase E1 component beta subunit
MPEQTFLDAIRSALAEEMRRDLSVYLFGEDVALGGPFGATKGLADEFGTNRVVNTPISEGTVMGLTTGAAIAGLRPVVEIMFIDFITLAMDQLVNHAAKLHYMSGGQLRIPLTIRVQCGITGAMGAHHSQSLEAWLTHVPGLKVLMPATPADAKGLLKAAIRDDNPVVFIEHRGLYGQKARFRKRTMWCPLGKQKFYGRVTRSRSLRSQAWLARRSAQRLNSPSRVFRGSGRSAQCFPSRHRNDCKFYKKNEPGHCRARSRSTSGIGAEIAALVQETRFLSSRLPVLRVAAPFAPIPAGRSLEAAFLPGKNLILEAVRRSIAFG